MIQHCSQPALCHSLWVSGYWYNGPQESAVHPAISSSEKKRPVKPGQRGICPRELFLTIQKTLQEGLWSWDSWGEAGGGRLGRTAWLRIPLASHRTEGLQPNVLPRWPSCCQSRPATWKWTVLSWTRGLVREWQTSYKENWGPAPL